MGGSRKSGDARTFGGERSMTGDWWFGVITGFGACLVLGGSWIANADARCSGSRLGGVATASRLFVRLFDTLPL
jgi:hypothetical protein